MKGITLAENGHFVNLIPSVDISGGKLGDRFHMRDAKGCSIMVNVGVSNAAFTKMIIKAYAAASGGVGVAIPYRLYSEETDAGDTLSSMVRVEATGYTPSANNNILYIAQFDAAALPDGYPWVELVLQNDSGGSIIAGAIAYLSGGRYYGDPANQRSAIA